MFDRVNHLSTLRYFRTKTLSDFLGLLAYPRIRSEAARWSRDVDTARLNELRAKYESAGKWSPWERFYVPTPNLEREVFRARKLGLHRNDTGPLKVLDLGTGPGYFLFLLKNYGHDCVGLDIENEILGGIAAVLDVDRRVFPLTKRTSNLPITGKFDVITGFQVAFDGTVQLKDDTVHADPEGPWTATDWLSFVKVLSTHCKKGARIAFTGVRSCIKGSEFYDSDVVTMFKSLGGKVSSGQVSLRFETVRQVLQAAA